MAAISDTSIVFKCNNCNCISNVIHEIKTDVEKIEKWNQNHIKRLELRVEQETVLNEFNTIAEEHNSHWYNFSSKWHVLPRPGSDFLDIVDFTKNKPVKSVPYDSSVMGIWLDFIHRKPVFNYIECPVCHCKNYMNRN